ncbi:GL10990 [Drosophila persimilis]|uniref:GL10990 n=1 Tax=Drosophila persimilis TaxID=7234 RepID=B4GC71_DROPE|nr:GL10990 [Drosophila persimilis]
MWVEARSVYIQLKSLVDSLKISQDDVSAPSSNISLEFECNDSGPMAIEFRLMIPMKVQLSQQLEQWQMDMHEQIDLQMRSKLLERPALAPKTPTSQPSRVAAKLAKRLSSYKLWSLFQR